MNFKTLSVMALAGLMVLGSCKKNENTDNNGSVLFAGIEQPTSNAKTSLDPSTGDITWTAGDKIMVNNGVETAEFRLTAGAGQTTATFNGPGAYADATTAYVAAFPAEDVTSISGTTVTFNIPSEQTPTTGNPMVAYGADENLTFTSVLSGLVIKLQGNGAAKTINKLVLTSNTTSEKLWGTYTFDANNGTALTYVDGGSNAVTLNLPAVTLATGQEYTTCVMVPAGSLANGFKIEIFYNGLSLKSATTSAAMEMVQNTIYNVTYKYPDDPATAGTAATQAELNVLLSEVAAGSYTGPININATGSTPTTFDFGGTKLPDDKQVVVAAGSNVEVSNLEATVTSASSGYPAAMIISPGANATLNNVTVTSTSTHDNTRALNIIGGTAGSEGTVVTLNNCTIDGGTAGYSRGLNTYSDGAPVTINVDGGEIYAGHYAINIPNDATNNALTINLSNASIASGWAAINIWGSNNTINATNCTLKGLNDKTYNAAGWNDFATIAFNEDNKDCIINLDNCDVYAIATTGNKQYAWRMYTGTTGTQFIMHGGSLTGTETNTEDEMGLYLKRIGGTDLEPIYSYDYDFVLLYDNVAMNWNGTTSTLNDDNHYSGTIGGGDKSQGKFVVEQASETESSKR